jgi:hypothetical protein
MQKKIFMIIWSSGLLKIQTFAPGERAIFVKIFRGNPYGKISLKLIKKYMRITLILMLASRSGLRGSRRK